MDRSQLWSCSCSWGTVTGMGEPVRLNLQDRLRLAESLLRAVEDSLTPLQRLLSEVHREIDRALREEEKSPRDEEICALRREVEQLRDGLTSRGAIERAKGILMHSHGVSESQAFDLLNEMSQRQRRKLRDLAGEIAEGVLNLRSVVVRPDTVPAHASPGDAPQEPPRGDGRSEGSAPSRRADEGDYSGRPAVAVADGAGPRVSG